MKVKLTDEQINSIKEEFDSFKEGMYAGRTMKERQELDQFFTPPDLTFKMLESYDIPEGKTLANITILDPTCGSGNLLVACLLAGADVKNIYGNEYDPAMVERCRQRLFDACRNYRKEDYKQLSDNDLNRIIKRNIHRGNALQKRCLNEFSTYYENMYRVEYIDDLNYAQGYFSSWQAENEEARSRHHKQQEAEAKLKQENNNVEVEELW